MIKVDIISGFLGAGKTTLIKKLLEETDVYARGVLIENEFGEIGIDRGFLQDTGVKIKELNSGCICCSLIGDFSDALKELIKTANPERIIIEPSGVGKLSDIKDMVLSNETLEINSLVTVIDVTKYRMYLRNFGEFFENQLHYATTVILSHSENKTPQEIEKAINDIRNYTDAKVITTPISQLSASVIMNVMENNYHMANELLDEVHHEHHSHEHHNHEHHDECCCGHNHEHHDDCTCEHDHDECTCNHEHHHHTECCCDHDADEVFVSVSLETAKSYYYDQLKQILSVLVSDKKFCKVLRAKGMLQERESEDWLYFDMIPGEFQIRKGVPNYTGQICIIGEEIDHDELEKLFETSDKNE